jgi:hypothetical protein
VAESQVCQYLCVFDVFSEELNRLRFELLLHQSERGQPRRVGKLVKKNVHGLVPNFAVNNGQLLELY